MLPTAPGRRLSTGLRVGTTASKAPNLVRYVVMYIGPVRTVRGDKKVEANCSYSAASTFLSPQTVYYCADVLLTLRVLRESLQNGLGVGPNAAPELE